MLAFVDRFMGSAFDWLDARFGPKTWRDSTVEEVESLRLRQVADEVRECLSDYLDVHALAQKELRYLRDDNAYAGTPQQTLLLAFDSVVRARAGLTFFDSRGPGELIHGALDTFNTAMVGGTVDRGRLEPQQRVLKDVFSTLVALQRTTHSAASSCPLVLDYLMSFFHAHQALRCVAEGTLGRDGTHWSHRPPSLGAPSPQA